MRLIKVFGGAAAALAMAAALGVSGSARAGAGGTDLPFNGFADGVVTEYVTGTNWLIDYTGSASQLGRCTRHENVTFSDDFTTFSGTITFLANDARNSEIRVWFQGGFTGSNDVAGTYTITGGEGRFEGASGTAEFVGHTDDFVHVSFSWKGTIND